MEQKRCVEQRTGIDVTDCEEGWCLLSKDGNKTAATPEDNNDDETKSESKNEKTVPADIEDKVGDVSDIKESEEADDSPLKPSDNDDDIPLLEKTKKCLVDDVLPVAVPIIAFNFVVRSSTSHFVLAASTCLAGLALVSWWRRTTIWFHNANEVDLQ